MVVTKICDNFLPLEARFVIDSLWGTSCLPSNSVIYDTTYLRLRVQFCKIVLTVDVIYKAKVVALCPTFSFLPSFLLTQARIILRRGNLS